MPQRRTDAGAGSGERFGGWLQRVHGQAAAMLLVGLDDELLIHSQGAALRCRSVLLPPGVDPIPFLDEILFGLGTLLLANWKRRKDPEVPGKPPIEGEASR